MKLARRFIAIAVPPHDREWILGDVEEEFDAIAAERGRAAATRWLCGETLRILAGAVALRRARRPPAHRTRPVHGDSIMRTIVQDVRYAFRLLGRSPAFTAIAVLTLAVGIGASVTVFSVIHGVLMKPLPYADPERLVRVFEEGAHAPHWPMGPANFRDYRAELRSFDGLAAYLREDLQLSDGDRPEQLRGMQVTAGFFAVLGWTPALGREFEPPEETAGRDDAVVLSHALWQRRFDSDPAILGRTMRLSGRSFRVVGVLPPGFQHIGGAFRSYGHGDTVDVWWVRTVPRDDQPRDRFQHYLNVVGRLKPGVTLDQARAELAAAAARLVERHPQTNAGWSAAATPLRDEIVGRAGPTLYALIAAANVVLLLAAVNVAGLLLGRAAIRAREIGVRAALGASRLRLARQLLVESLVLALSGGLLGALAARAGVGALAAWGPADIPRLTAVSVDGVVLLYALGATIVTAVLFGLAPAIHLVSGSVRDTLTPSGRAATGTAQPRVRRFLVAGEVALAFVLVASAGLLLRSFVVLNRADPGFDADGVITASVALPPLRYDQKTGVAFHARLADRVRALPGVRAAGLSSDLPWTGYDENTGFSIAGRSYPRFEGPEARYHFITPGYLQAVGTPLVAGRDIAPGDGPQAPSVVLVNESAARRYWSTPEAAVGARLQLWGAERSVAGVIGDVADAPSDDRAVPAIYFPQAQVWYSQDMRLVVRTERDPRRLVEPIRRLLAELDPALPLANVASLDAVAGAAFATRRFTLWLVGLFAAAALFLAAIGIYGVMSQAVTERRHEFGLRQALGARPVDILRLVLSSGSVMGVCGLVFGAALVAASTRWVRAFLYHIDPLDPATLGAVALLLAAVTLAGSYVPARRATRVDPATALRD
jgi:putative ABC transport system permease protein